MSVRLIDFRKFSWSAVIVVVLGFMLVAAGIMAEPFGIAVHIPDDSRLDLAVDLGVDWIRIDFIWALAEPEQDVFDWARYDLLIAEAQERDLRIFATIAGTPAWATSGVEGPGVPDSPADWSDICYRAAARYRGRVEAWGMWNEPNLDRFWEGTRRDYLDQILRRGADAVHAADAQALVAGPELAHLSSADWDGWMQVCVGGASEELDVVTHHVYPSGVTAADVTKKLEDGGPYPWDPPSVREVLRDAGWFGRPFWLTESGVESDKGGEYAQAVFYENLISEWFPVDDAAKWIDSLFFYQLVDNPAIPDITFGIVGPAPNRVPKLAFEYYQDLIRETPVEDARVLSWTSDPVLTPGQWNQIVIRVVNEGSTTWRQDDGLSVSVVGFSADWEIEGGLAAQDTDVAPGRAEDILLDLRPPPANWDYKNGRHNITVRMARGDGRGLGSPLRAGVISGWRSLPEIVRQPLTEVVDLGRDAVFRVVADGAGDLEYAWFRNGMEIRDISRFSGVETSVLTVHESDAADTGEYRCRVTSMAGWVLSRNAELLLTGGDRGGPREGGGRTPDRWGPTPSFESFFPKPGRTRRQLNRQDAKNAKVTPRKY